MYIPYIIHRVSHIHTPLRGQVITVYVYRAAVLECRWSGTFSVVTESKIQVDYSVARGLEYISVKIFKFNQISNDKITRRL